MAQTLVIVNPNASQARNRSSRSALLEELGVALERRDGAPPRIVETAAREETGPAVEAALADGIATVVGVGGDGTLRDIAAALIGTGVPLGIVPAGTGNQLAAVLGIPLALSDAAAALATARPRGIDLGKVTLRLTDAPETTTIFTIGCGAGFDARLMATTPRHWKQRFGRAAYFAQALVLGADLDVVPYRLTIDGKTIETDATIAMVGNMGQLVPGLLGPRLPLEPDDGLLDLIVVGARSPLQGIKGLIDQMFRTSLGGEHGAASMRLRGRSISVEADRPEPLQVDGDYVGEGSLEARVVPDGADVLVPAAGT